MCVFCKQRSVNRSTDVSFILKQLAQGYVHKESSVKKNFQRCVSDQNFIVDRQVCQFCGLEGLVVDIQKHEEYCSQGTEKRSRVKRPPAASKFEIIKVKTDDNKPGCTKINGFVPPPEDKISLNPSWKDFLVNKAENQAMCQKCCTVFNINIQEQGTLQMTGNMGIHAKNDCTKPQQDRTFSSRKFKSREEQLEWKRKYNKMYTQRNPTSKCPDCVVLVPHGHRKSHQAEHHSPILPEVCDECSYRALTKTAIKSHKSKWHSDHLKILPCPLGCGKKSANKILLDYHVSRSCLLSKAADKYKDKHREDIARKKKRREEKRKEIYKNFGIKYTPKARIREETQNEKVQ